MLLQGSSIGSVDPRPFLALSALFGDHKEELTNLFNFRSDFFGLSLNLLHPPLQVTHDFRELRGGGVRRECRERNIDPTEEQFRLSTGNPLHLRL